MSQHVCPECGYRYDEAVGNAHMGFAAGTPWADLPEGFDCPDCAISYKEDFTLSE